MSKKLVAVLALFGATTAAHAESVRCTAVHDAVNVYYSAPFEYEIPADVDPMFLDMHPIAQTGDFEAYVRGHYGLSGAVDTSCSVVVEGAIKPEGDVTYFGTTMHYVHTGYAPKAR